MPNSNKSHGDSSVNNFQSNSQADKPALDRIPPECLTTIHVTFTEFLNAPRWICWRPIPDNDGKINKVPIGKNGRHASGTLMNHATTLNEAIMRNQASSDLQLGFVLNGDGVGGIDLDACRDPETGAIVDWAEKIINEFQSYTEVSPSGTGVKIFTRGAPSDLKNKVLKMEGAPIKGKNPQIEAYVTDRYFAVTGQHVQSTPKAICEVSWSSLVKRLNKETKDEKTTFTGRDDALFKLGCSLRAKGLTETAIEAALRAENNKNSNLHPNFKTYGEITDGQLAKILRSVSKYDEGQPSVEHDPRLIDLLERYSIVNVDGNSIILRWKKKRLFDGPHGEHEVPEMSSAASFHLLHADKSTVMAGKSVLISKLFIKRARRYEDGLVLEPEKARTVGNSLNLWRGFTVMPRPGDSSKMKTHLREVIAAEDDEFHKYMLRWLAWTVQNPGQQAGVAIVMRGKEGTGKGVFANALCRIFGPHGLQISNPHHLTGHFNSHLAQCVLLFVDEGFWAGDRKNEGSLKRTITESTLFIEPKYINPFSVKNCLHILIASNNDWVVPAGIEARRFAVTEVSDDKRSDTAYFDALNKEINEGGLEAMLHELLNTDLEGWHPLYSGDVPQTKALQDQRERSLRGIDALVLDLAGAGQLPCNHIENKPYAAVTTDLQEMMGFWRYVKSNHQDLRRETEHGMLRELRKYGCKSCHSGNRRFIEFPPLDELRAALDKKLGPQEWDDTTKWMSSTIKDEGF